MSVPPGVVFAKAPLGKQWPASQQVSMNDVDHSPFDRLLHKYVDSDGYVNYAAWKASSADRAALRGYLNSLSRASTQSGTTDARLAFWINAYNAVTIEGIFQEYPTSSIRNHTAKLWGYNIWDDLPLLVGGKSYSLNQIEHEVLRKMGEPRIHFAIVCASVGCPRLLNEAYTPERVRDQLASNARDFFARPKNLKVDPRNRRLQMSSILSWFGEDFGPSQSARLKYLMPYLPPAAKRLAADPKVSVSFLDYDWSLNDQAKKR
ncbi:MAG: DUF547 domain-containing protein [Maioricimonas sp. JB045]